MFLDCGFDPVTDIKRNTFGVLEFLGIKPKLERAFDRYLPRAKKTSTHSRNKSVYVKRTVTE